jgi:hydrogenase maturation protease
MSSVKTLVVGLGNPILSDDGIGWRIVARVRELLFSDPAFDSRVEVMEVCVGGLTLAEMFVGYDHVIVVDAIMTSCSPAGTVYHLGLADMLGTLNMTSAHDTNLATALRALRRFGADIPTDGAIDIVAVEAQDVWTFSEECTPEVEASVPVAVEKVMGLIN